MKTKFVLPALFLFTAGICCIGLTPDNDLWARLIAGGYIVNNFSLLTHDFLSYTPSHFWYDHEWGASVFLYSALKYFGDFGLIFLKIFLLFITIFFCYKTVEIRKPVNSVPYNILYYVVMILAVMHSVGNVTRCLLFTCVFFAMFVYILEYSRMKNTKLIYLLPVIMIFWANIHGGCISGLGLIALYILGEFLNKKPFKKYIFVLIGCLLALFINPYGFNYVKFLFYAVSMDRSFITEWAGSFNPKFIFDYIEYKIYLIFLIFIQIYYLVKCRITYKNIDKTKILIIISMIYLSISHIRHQTFFIFTAGTLLYDEVYFFINNAFSCILKNKKFVFTKEIIVYMFVLVLPIVCLLGNKQITITQTEYPRFAVEFIKINNIKGNLLVNFNWGSYAAYKLYPQNFIFMDGRYEEVYNPDLLIEMKDFFLVENDWKKVIRDYKTDVMILEKKYPVYEKILSDKEWKLVFENNLSGVFVPASFDRKVYKLPNSEDEYYNKGKFDTNIPFFK